MQDFRALVVDQLVKSKANAVFLQSAVLLRAAPAYRKYNKVDVGTADKLGPRGGSRRGV
ncbi:DUF1464 family protein [Acidilobus sp.]|jgi:predicted butyrate kinase (DUF1464 family)|uniref:DUF1464 family protein n=1 Tax=Acidilobus sp. TaxID=1872109 RepID=UPI003D04CB21